MGTSSPLFIDSNFWVALFNDSDSRHNHAIQLVSQTSGLILVISDYIFLEVMTVLSQKRGRLNAVEAGQYFLTSPLIIKVHIDAWLHEKSWQIFQEVNRKNVSFVDCSVIAVMKAERIDTLLTFDTKDFRLLQKQYRFKLYSID